MPIHVCFLLRQRINSEKKKKRRGSVPFQSTPEKKKKGVSQHTSFRRSGGLRGRRPSCFRLLQKKRGRYISPNSAASRAPHADREKNRILFELNGWAGEKSIAVISYMTTYRQGKKEREEKLSLRLLSSPAERLEPRMREPLPVKPGRKKKRKEASSISAARRRPERGFLRFREKREEAASSEYMRRSVSN